MLSEHTTEQLKRWQEQWREPILTGLLVLLALEIFVTVPLSATGDAPPPFAVAAQLLVLVFAVLATAQNRTAVIVILGSAALAVIANVKRVDHPDPATICISAGSVVLFTAALSWVVARAVFGPGRITFHRIRGAIVLYLNIAIAFAALYEIVTALFPGAISGVVPRGAYLVLGPKLTYFSLQTLTSTGYGDLLPVHPLARSLANLEAVIGQLFPPTLIARVVAMEIQARGR